MNKNTKHQMSFALIGCGRISQVHLQTIASEPRARLVAVADTDRRAAASAAEAFGVRAFHDPLRMLETLRPEAVILCTPPNTHRDLGEAALLAGANVLCEKPLALSAEDAEVMIATAEQAGRTLMMASKFRYVQDVVRAKGFIESGVLGEIMMFKNEFCSHINMKDRWNASTEVAGGGVLIDNGSHSIDIIRYLIGPIDSIHVMFGKNWQKLEVEDTCQLLVRCVCGVIASVDLSWSVYTDTYFIHVFGTEGILEVGWKESRYRQGPKFDWVPFGNGYDKFKAVSAQLANFIDTITGKGDPLITAEDALESVRVIQTGYRTANQGRWEKVAP